MRGDPRVQGLVEEILESDRTAEEVCQDCPELLNAVRDRLRRVRLGAQVDSLFPTAGSAPTPADPSDGKPRQLPGYEVQAMLGRGGMGVVYKARHLRLNRIVALKMLLTGAYAGPHERARFRAKRRRWRACVTRTSSRSMMWGTTTGALISRWSYLKGAAWPNLWRARRSRPSRRPRSDHTRRGRAGRAPGRDCAPRSEASQHPAHGRGNAQGRRFRAGAAALTESRR